MLRPNYLSVDFLDEDAPPCLSEYTAAGLACKTRGAMGALRGWLDPPEADALECDSDCPNRRCANVAVGAPPEAAGGRAPRVLIDTFAPLDCSSGEGLADLSLDSTFRACPTIQYNAHS